MMQRTTSPSTPRSVRAWDWPTRAFHWALVLGLLSAWVSFKYANVLGDTFLKWHRYNGYAILILLVFRVIWGFAGSSTSRLSAFIRWPWRAAMYGLDLLRGRERHFLGHNPLGTYMILAVFGVVAAQAFAGLFIVEHNDLTWGPLYRWASEGTQKVLLSWHLWTFYWIILPLVGLHITANVLYQLVKKDPLVTAMITGRKPAAAYEDQVEAQIPENVGLRAAVCLAIAAVVVLGGIVAAGGKLFY